MKGMVRKLKDNSGVTIIMALLFMLICVMVSTVLLAAAGTASRDVSPQRDQQQAYLAVSSAVNFMKNDICNCKYQTDDPATQVTAISSDKETEMSFSNLLRAALQEDRSKDPYSIEFDLGFSEDALKDLTVHVKFTMDKTCAITAACTAYKDTEKKEPAYRMTAHFTSDSVEGNSGYDTWVLSSVSKGS